METMGTVAACIAAVFGVLTFFREVILNLARAEADVSGSFVRVKITNPGRRRLFIRDVRLVRASVGQDHYDPETGTGHITDTGKTVFHAGVVCPAGGSVEIGSHVVSHCSPRYAKASLRPALLWILSNEYRVVVRLIC